MCVCGGGGGGVLIDIVESLVRLLWEKQEKMQESHLHADSYSSYLLHALTASIEAPDVSADKKLALFNLWK